MKFEKSEDEKRWDEVKNLSPLIYNISYSQKLASKVSLPNFLEVIKSSAFINDVSFSDVKGFAVLNIVFNDLLSSPCDKLKILRFQKLDFSAEDLRKLKQVIEKNNSIIGLELSKVSKSFGYAANILREFRSQRKFSFFGLDEMIINPNFTAEFEKFLTYQDQLTELKLSCLVTIDIDFAEIINLIARFPKIKYLDISDNEITQPNSLQALKNLLQKDQLTGLSVRNCNLQMETLFKSMHDCKKLESLDISYNKMKKQDLKLLFNCLNNKVCFRRFIFQSTSLVEEGLPQNIFENCKSLDNLTDLTLSYQPNGAEINSLKNLIFYQAFKDRRLLKKYNHSLIDDLKKNDFAKTPLIEDIFLLKTIIEEQGPDKYELFSLLHNYLRHVNYFFVSLVYSNNFNHVNLSNDVLKLIYAYCFSGYELPEIKLNNPNLEEIVEKRQARS